MLEVLDCVPCYLKQVVNTFNLVGLEDEEARRLVRSVLPTVAELDPKRTPAENMTVLLHRVYELLGDKDPYLEAKHESNQLAQKMLPKLRKIVERSVEPLYTACQVAIAGNIIDMGILPDFDVDASVQDALASEFSGDNFQVFQEQIKTARRILMIGDNSGEIVFDRLLVEQLKRQGSEVIYAVKGAPILNDATMEDALEVGMAEVAVLITNGNNYIGTLLELCSSEFRQEVNEADVIISKGQGNYESLESTPEVGEKTFFLLRAKCPAVAQKLGVKLGDMVLSRNRPRVS